MPQIYAALSDPRRIRATRQPGVAQGDHSIESEDNVHSLLISLEKGINSYRRSDSCVIVYSHSIPFFALRGVTRHCVKK